MLNKFKILENLNILYVEDDKSTRDIITELLKNFTAKIVSAKDGEVAYKLYKKEKIDLIITDLEMPVEGGLSFISKVRFENYHIPIIVFTAYTDKSHLLPCANLNIQGYLEKPISYSKLEDVFQSIIIYLDKKEKIINIGEIIYNINDYFILKNEEQIPLTKKEKMFLDLLITNKNRIVSYENIELILWKNEEEVMTSMALRTLAKNLRKKIPKENIQNISGYGYKIVY